MFGQQQTQAFGGTQTGGIFGGQKPAQSSGFGGTAFGQPQPQASTGMFGQQQPIGGGAGLYGQAQAQPQAQNFGGGFGSNTSQPAQGAQGLFGQPQASQGLSFGQGQPAQSNFLQGNTGGMPGSTSAFGQTPGQPSAGLFGSQPQAPTQTSSFFGGAQTGFQGAQQTAYGAQPQSAFGGLGQTQNIQPKSGFFNQNQQSAGITSNFGQPQQVQQPQGGLFGQGQTPSAIGVAQPQQMQPGTAQMIYSEPQYYPQQTSTINRPYQMKVHAMPDQSNQQLHFTNIRADDEFQRPSTQMLRFYDMKAQKGQPSPNFEFVAMQEFNQNQQRYPILQKLQSMLQGAGKATPTQANAFTAPNLGGATSNFGQPAMGGQTSGWGQPAQQQQQQSTLFGLQQPQAAASGFFNNQGALSASPKPAGLFGASSTQQSSFGQQSQPFGGLGASSTPTQQPGSSLFGQQTPAQQPAGASLFSQQQQPQQQANQYGATSGLFGNNQPQQEQPASQGIFGGQPQQQPGQASLFGGQQPQQQPQQQSSLFGGGQQAPGGQGLFGAKTMTPTPQINVGLGINTGNGSSMFGQPTGQQQNPGSSLFGGNQPKPAGGLFGNNPAPNQGGLFGAQAAPTQQPSLFGAPQQPGQMQNQGGLYNQQQPQNYVDLYSSKDPLGLQNSFLSRDHPMDHIQKDLDQIKKQVDSKYPAPPANDKPVNINVIYWQPDQPPVNGAASYMDTAVYEEEAARQQAKQDAKVQKLLQSQQNSKKSIITAAPISLYKTQTQQATSSIKPDLSHKKDNLSRTTTRDTIKVTFSYAHTPRDVYNQTFEIHKSRDTNDLIKKAVQWLTGEFNYDGPSVDVKVLFNDSPIVSNKSLKDAGIEDDTILKVQLPSSTLQVNQLVMDNDQASDQILPKAPKEGYQSTPSLEKLRQMTVKELESVDDFTVFNQFGSVMWVGKTDVTRVDLKDIVTIEQSNCEVYDDERHKVTKPSVGQKLNKQAIITLKGIQPKVGQTFTQKEQLLRKRIEKDGDAQHLSYDGNKFEWSFKVEHFTKWGEGDDDEEMDSTAPQPAQVPQAKPVSVTTQFVQETKPQIAVQKQQPSEIEVVMEDFDSAQSQSQNESFIFKNQVQQKRFHMSERASPQQSVAIPRIETPIDKSTDYDNKILNKILKRDPIFTQAASFNTTKPSNTETLKFLSSMGIKNVEKTSLGRRAVPKPCFHPLGKGILFTQGKSISLLKIPQVEEFKIQDVISKHLKAHQASQIQSQLQNLNLDSQDQMMYETNSERNPFEDEFLRSLLQQELPITKLFNNQRQINDFLNDLARHYSKAQLNNKLSHEFYVVCLLNALYGDPTRQLNQLHRKLRGPESKFQTQVEGALDEESLSVQKQRRNAATEVVRLLCQQEYPVNSQVGQMVSDDQVYMIALQLLQIGDLRQAVQFLSKHKKTKLALLVSQSVSNQFSMQQVSQVVGYQGAAKKIIDFISGKAQPQPQWEKNFLYALMFTECHSKPLTDIVKEMCDVNKNNESLMWKLLMTYARIQHSDSAIHEMKGQLTPGYNSRDFRLRWLTHLVLRSALLQQKLNQNQVSNVWSCHIPDGVLTTSASKYVYQLLNQDNYVEACQVTMLIPETQIRTSLLFKILMKTSTTEQSLIKAQSDLCDQLQIPQKLRLAALAIRLQTGDQAGQAVDMWVKCGNLVWAEDLYRMNVLPSHLKKQVDLSSIKQLYLENSLFAPNQLIKPAKIDDKILSQMQQLYPKNQQQQWKATPSGLYMRVRLVQRDFCRNKVQILYDELNEISQLIPDTTDHLSKWLREEVAEMFVAILNRKRDGRAPILDRVPQAQAKRGYEQMMMKGLINTAAPERTL